MLQMRLVEVASDAGDSLPLIYDPPLISAYWERRPVAVLTRIVQLLSERATGAAMQRPAADRPHQQRRAAPRAGCSCGPRAWSVRSHPALLPPPALLLAPSTLPTWPAGISGGFLGGLLIDTLRGKVAENQVARAIDLRNIMTSLGPAYIKLGQALSIRPDLLSPAAMNEMQKLCDKVLRGEGALQESTRGALAAALSTAWRPPIPSAQVPSFDSGVAMKMISQELGRPWQEVYAELTPEPIAAASLGQVGMAIFFFFSCPSGRGIDLLTVRYKAPPLCVPPMCCNVPRSIRASLGPRERRWRSRCSALTFWRPSPWTFS